MKPRADPGAGSGHTPPSRVSQPGQKVGSYSRGHPGKALCLLPPGSACLQPGPEASGDSGEVLSLQTLVASPSGPAGGASAREGRSDRDHLGRSTGSELTVAHLLEEGTWLRGALKPNPTLGSWNCSTSNTCPPGAPPHPRHPDCPPAGSWPPWNGGRGNTLRVWSFRPAHREAALRGFSEAVFRTHPRGRRAAVDPGPGL